MYYYKHIVFSLVCFVCQLSNAAVYEPPAIGFAEYVELGQEQFVVSLNAESFDLASDQSFSLRGRQQINLKVSAARLSPRKLLRFFIQGAAVNNDTSRLKNNAIHMASFAALIKGRLKKGDHLSLSYDGESQTAISINEVALTEISSAEFFSMILSVFVGDVPPTREFKNAILGIEESASARARYAELAAAPERKLAIRDWLAVAVKTLDDASKPQAEAAAAVPARNIRVPSQNAENNVSTQAENPVVADVEGGVSPALEAEAKPKPKPDSKPESSSKGRGTKVSLLGGKDRVKSAIQLAISGSPSPATNLLGDREEASSSPITATNILKVQRYSKRLLNLSRRQIIYPKKALQLNRSGSVLARVLINRQGRLKNISLVNSAQYPDLNKAVVRGIKKAQPFPPIPKELNTEEFSFVVPVVFKLE